MAHITILEYPQFIGLNFVVYLISLCRTDVLSSKNLKKRFLVSTTGWKQKEKEGIFQVMM